MTYMSRACLVWHGMPLLERHGTVLLRVPASLSDYIRHVYNWHGEVHLPLHLASLQHPGATIIR